jgi:sec-independent protein translocase protein TatA
VFDISPIQIIIVLAIALLVFGPKRLPEMGRSIGRGIRDFKDGLTNDHRDDGVAEPTRTAIEGEPAQAEPTLEEIVKENATPEPVEDESREPVAASRS